MHISIHSLKRTLFDNDAKAINCKTQSGEITILDHHRPLISILVPGVVKVTTPDGKEEFFPIRNGLLEVKQDNEARFIVEEE
jgi:F-type H+-transporting ATPase subunit epsilon